MAKTSLILKATDQNGKTVNKTITDVNPDCSNEVLKTLGQKINALTTNFYGNTTRIDKIDCDLESGGGTLTPTLTLAETSIPLATLRQEISGEYGYKNVGITYNGDADLSITFKPAVQESSPMCAAGMAYSAGNWSMTIFHSPANAKAGRLIIKAPATENYKAAEATFTITA